MRVTAESSANLRRYRQNDKLFERRSRTSTAKANNATNQGMDHFYPVLNCMYIYILRMLATASTTKTIMTGVYGGFSLWGSIGKKCERLFLSLRNVFSIYERGRTCNA